MLLSNFLGFSNFGFVFFGEGMEYFGVVLDFFWVDCLMGFRFGGFGFVFGWIEVRGFRNFLRFCSRVVEFFWRLLLFVCIVGEG